MTTPVTNTPQTATGTAAGVPTGSSTATQDSQGLQETESQFLTLLTTQLQNQDPLDPMDSSQFTNQLVEFSGVEQQIKSNATLTQLLQSQQLNLTALGVSFIGKNVQVAGTQFTTDGTQPVSFSYSLPSDAATGTMSISDASGNVVYNGTPNLKAGTYDFTWDGKDTSGAQAPAGTYTISLSASDATGASISTATYVPGHVTGLETGDDGSLLLDVNGQKVSMGDIEKVLEAPATAPTTADTSTPTDTSTPAS